MKTYSDVIEETIAYYRDHPRGMYTPEQGFAECVYYNPDTGAMCAVGRCLKDAAALEDFRGPVPEEGWFAAPLRAELKPEYAHLDNHHFWRDLQQLHDNDHNWQNKGNNRLPAGPLTEEGEEYADDLHCEYGKGAI